MKFITIIIFFALSLFKIGYCEETKQSLNIDYNKNMVNIETRFDPMTLRQICKEIEKQTGVKAIIAKSHSNEYKNYKNIPLEDMTLEVDFENVNVYDAIQKIQENIQNKYYSKFHIYREGNCIIVDEKSPGQGLTHGQFPTKTIKLKHISANKIQEIIRDIYKSTSVAVDTRINGIIYQLDENKESIRRIIEINDIDPNKLDDLLVSINTASKGMTIKQIAGELNKQIGNHIIVSRAVGISTNEIKINFKNFKLKDAINAIIIEHNKNLKPPQNPFDRDEVVNNKYLCIRKEKDLYIFCY